MACGLDVMNLADRLWRFQNLGWYRRRFRDFVIRGQTRFKCSNTRGALRIRFRFEKKLAGTAALARFGKLSTGFALGILIGQKGWACRQTLAGTTGAGRRFSATCFTLPLLAAFVTVAL